MNAEPSVCIVGSMNMDLTVTTDKVPQQGETVMGNEFLQTLVEKGLTRRLPQPEWVPMSILSGRLGMMCLVKHFLLI